MSTTGLFYILPVLGILLFLGLLYQGGFLFTRVVLFSEVRGQLFLNGSPQSNIRVTRAARFTWRDTVVFDETVTDKNGEFRFPQRTDLLWFVFPHEPFVKQDIYIDDPALAQIYGREFRMPDQSMKKVINLWMFDRRDYEKDSEFPNKKK